MLTARGKLCTIRKHAHEGMHCERPPVAAFDVERVLEAPDHDDGRRATKWIGGRTVIVYYTELEDVIHVRSVSATRSRKL